MEQKVENSWSFSSQEPPIQILIIKSGFLTPDLKSQPLYHMIVEEIRSKEVTMEDGSITNVNDPIISTVLATEEQINLKYGIKFSSK